ncbi:hypothetical protein [Streptomyces sp. NPDC059378]|uniref:hypothetical protein n=1 Tax=Streptomyces sp. NPDC059378 TaxID=3346815 RepID=UPI0036C4B388
MTPGDDYGYKIRDLDSRIEDLENDLESLKRSFGYIEDLEYELRSIRDAARDADDKADEVSSNLEDLDNDARGHIADTDRTLKKLTARIQLMEANLAAADKMPHADFDSFPASWYALGARAGKARAARTLLLTAFERESYSSSIRSHRDAVGQRNEQYAAVLTAAKTLATTTFGTPQHEQAGQAYTTARRQADQYARTTRQGAAKVRRAQSALTQDRETRVRDAELLAEGVEAQKELNGKLRQRISEAIRDRSLLPIWFVTVLGPAAPARNTEDWLEAATSLLAYRITYNITDQVLALGEEPDDDDPGHDQWRQELTEALHRW